MLSKSKIQFRNQVIHKGKIPTKEEAIDYGNAVLLAVRSKFFRIRKEMKEAEFKVHGYYINECKRDEDKGKTIPQLGSGLILDQPPSEKTLDDPLNDLIRYRQHIKKHQHR